MPNYIYEENVMLFNFGRNDFSTKLTLNELLSENRLLDLSSIMASNLYGLKGIKNFACFWGYPNKHFKPIKHFVGIFRVKSSGS